MFRYIETICCEYKRKMNDKDTYFHKQNLTSKLFDNPQCVLYYRFIYI